MSEKTAYPLSWPIGWKRTTPGGRTSAQFGSQRMVRNAVTGQDMKIKANLTIGEATKRVLDELAAFDVPDWMILISSDLKLRQDGLPISNQREPNDPGVAVYWTRSKEKQRCMAIDRYDRIADNLAAIAATLNAMRAIDRHGGATILDRAFSGFQALPNPEQAWQVLGLATSHASRDEIEDAYRRLVSQHHPDRGGDTHQMARINAARDELLR